MLFHIYVSLPQVVFSPNQTLCLAKYDFPRKKKVDVPENAAGNRRQPANPMKIP